MRFLTGSSDIRLSRTLLLLMIWILGAYVYITRDAFRGPHTHPRGASRRSKHPDTFGCHFVQTDERTGLTDEMAALALKKLSVRIDVTTLPEVETQEERKW